MAADNYLENAPGTETEEAKPKGKPGAWDPDAARDHVYAKSDALRHGEDPRDANLRKFFGESAEDAEYKRADWDLRAESDEMLMATNKFLRNNGLTHKSPLMEKLNDPDFYLAHGDVLEAREAGDYDAMLRLAKGYAERELNLDVRRAYIRALQEERSPGRESFEAYQKRMAKAGR